MPLARYGVLKGTAIDRRLGAGQSPHYQIHVVDTQLDHRIAINVKSALSPSVLEYRIDDDFRHPITQGLAGLAPGFHALGSAPGGLALDFIRGNLFDPADMRTLPHDVPGPDNDLNEALDHYVQRAMSAEEVEVYAFGQKWGPEDVKDKYFGFRPGSGIHDIHMNQGNAAQFKHDDGVWQDGGLILRFPAQDQWVGIFLKFQSQAWHTDDVTGHQIPAAGGGTPSDPTTPQPGLPTADHPDGLVRIVGALVNAVVTPEVEMVTLLNTSPRAIDLAGWVLMDKQKNRQPLAGSLPAGETLRLQVAAPVQLSNQGGLITLLNEDGLRVHGVAYTRDQVRDPGWTVVF